MYLQKVANNNKQKISRHLRFLVGIIPQSGSVPFLLQHPLFVFSVVSLVGGGTDDNGATDILYVTIFINNYKK